MFLVPIDYWGKYVSLLETKVFKQSVLKTESLQAVLSIKPKRPKNILKKKKTVAQTTKSAIIGVRVTL